MEVVHHKRSSGKDCIIEVFEGCSSDPLDKYDFETDLLIKHGKNIFNIRKKTFTRDKIKNPPIHFLGYYIEKLWFRFPFIFFRNDAVILDGFKKKTNQIELKDVKKAIRRYKSYI